MGHEYEMMFFINWMAEEKEEKEEDQGILKKPISLSSYKIVIAVVPTLDRVSSW